MMVWLSTWEGELPPFQHKWNFLKPQAILDTYWIKQGGWLIEESLIQWKHISKEEATWEPTQKLLDMFLTLDLEDKDPLGKGSNDRLHRSRRGLHPIPKYVE